MVDRSDPDLHCGDCLEVLPRLVADRGAGFDHIITDPPYEDVHHAHHARGTIARTDGRGAPRPVPYAGVGSIREAAAQAMVAASAGWVLVFCLAEGVRPWHDALTGAGARWHGTMAWIKPDAAPQFAGIGPARGFECIAVAWAGSGRRRWNGGGARGVLTYNTAKGGLPGSKPVPVMAALSTCSASPARRSVIRLWAPAQQAWQRCGQVAALRGSRSIRRRSAWRGGGYRLRCSHRICLCLCAPVRRRCLCHEHCAFRPAGLIAGDRRSYRQGRSLRHCTRLWRHELACAVAA